MTIEEMKKIREERGISLAKLSEYTGVPTVTLQKVFAGTSKNPRKSTLDAIERVLGGDEQIYQGKAYNYETASQTYTPGPLILAETNAYGSALSRQNTDSDAGEIPAHGGDLDVCEAVAYYTGQHKRQGEYTVQDFMSLPDKYRAELIDGVLYDMAPPRFVHQDCSGLVFVYIYNFIRKNKGKCKVVQAPVGVQLDCDDKTMLEPDLVVVCDRSKITYSCIFGAPDFVLEVLSPSTRKRDMTLKFSKYEAAGVREYWVLDTDRQKLITYNFMQENWIPEVHNLEGKIGLQIFDGDCEIDLEELAESIREFGEKPQNK